MGTIIHTEYLVPLGANDRNNTRRLFIHLGRYHGFDTMGSGGTAGATIPIEISHTETCDYVDNTNAEVSVAAFITGHGAVVETDETPTVNVLPNASGITKYQVFWAQYTWVDVVGGASVSYGTDGQISAEPKIIPTLVPTKTPLGYFTILDGATDITDVTYTPFDVPNVANKPDANLGLYALLVGNNSFTGMNLWWGEDLPLVNLIEDTREDGSPYFVLRLSDDANAYNVPALPTTIPLYTITELTFLSVRTPQEGEILTVYFAPSNVQLQWSNDNNLNFPAQWLSLSLSEGALFTFQRINGKYQVLSMTHTLTKALDGQSARILTNESEIQDHGQRINVLENTTINWVNIIAGGTAVGDWVINYLQYATIGGLTYLRASIVTDGGTVAAGDITLATHVLGADVSVSAFLQSGGLATTLPYVTFVLDTGVDEINLYHGSQASGTAFQYVLPPTVIL